MSVYEGHGVTLHHADCLDVLRSLPDCSVDSVVCDPPYALGFMGREWDTFGMDVGRGAQARSQRRAEVTPTGEGHSTSAGPYLASGVDSLRAAGLPFQRWCEAWATECLRVLKPGGHLLAFGGTRTWHRLACAVEDAGFEMRDSIAWLYGSGFPKSMDVGKAIDKAAGAERAVVGSRTLTGTAASSSAHVGNLAGGSGVGAVKVVDVTAPATPDAEQWQGWGTALKPAFEPVVVARKPLKGTVAANVLAWGTGALNIDGCRVEGEFTSGWSKSGSKASENDSMSGPNYARGPKPDNPAGRWPANVVLDGPMAAALDEQSGTSESRIGKPRGAASGDGWGMTATGAEYADTGGASRFFYTTKAASAERPRYSKSVLRLRDGLTPEQVGHVRARLAEAGVRVD